MYQINFIFDLVKWIESNLDGSLQIDDIAKKAGYSKWHLQRMFKNMLGQTLGTYIRFRRLVAIALKLKNTNKAIVNIAVEYHFESQQSLTRAFKKQFGVTPGYYRRNNRCINLHIGF
ncbi:hypothetical protein GCM10023211_21770 [Orbus sasakiae]|uniref:HTH araC/xylS-type domain-containing protein n=1 Tax=Orbus sasakiae TaxID=1078475 RepID=A0ABP9NB87_9GAMM